MLVTVRLFAMMAQELKTGVLTLDLEPGSRVSDVRKELEKRFGKLTWPKGTMMAVNQSYTGPHQVLEEGNEVAVIPPVSGG